jgi:hypothetical protein
VPLSADISAQPPTPLDRVRRLLQVDEPLAFDPLMARREGGDHPARRESDQTSAAWCDSYSGYGCA